MTNVAGMGHMLIVNQRQHVITVSEGNLLVHVMKVPGEVGHSSTHS
jgi:hypothetical protein